MSLGVPALRPHRLPQPVPLDRRPPPPLAGRGTRGRPQGRRGPRRHQRGPGRSPLGGPGPPRARRAGGRRRGSPRQPAQPRGAGAGRPRTAAAARPLGLRRPSRSRRSSTPSSSLARARSPSSIRSPTSGPRPPSSSPPRASSWTRSGRSTSSQHFRQRIPHGRLYVGKRRPSDGKLHPDEDRLLALATGQRTVLELAQSAKLSEFDATKILFRLLEGGYASVSELKHGEVAAPARGRSTSRASETEPAVRVVATFEGSSPRSSATWPPRARRASSSPPPTPRSRAGALVQSPVLRDLRLGADGRCPTRGSSSTLTRRHAARSAASRWPRSGRRSPT